MSTRVIITTNVFPPIPDRRFDWCAYEDGTEESGHVGWGSTREEALADLARLDKERSEAEGFCRLGSCCNCPEDGSEPCSNWVS